MLGRLGPISYVPFHPPTAVELQKQSIRVMSVRQSGAFNGRQVWWHSSHQVCVHTRVSVHSLTERYVQYINTASDGWCSTSFVTGVCVSVCGGECVCVSPARVGGIEPLRVDNRLGVPGCSLCHSQSACQLMTYPSYPFVTSSRSIRKTPELLRHCGQC